MKKRIWILFSLLMLSFAQSVGDSYKINLTNFFTWDKNRDIFNSATGELTLKEGYGGGGIYPSYTGNYNYIEFASKSFTQEIKQNLAISYSQLNRKFIKKGIPIVVGETSAFRVLISKQERIKWISYFSKLTSRYGIALIYWDAPQPVGSNYYGDQFDRANLKFYEPDFVQAMLDNWKCK